MKRCKLLTIFEGPDGGGKTTAAKKWAEQTGSLYVHFPSLPQVGDGLARMYVEAMLPALLGYQSVVFDRSWLSEAIYGAVFREGRDRLDPADVRMLERLAFRCSPVVINCLPNEETTVSNFKRRQAAEMLRSERQLREVYDCYCSLDSDLPIVNFDYEIDSLDRVFERANKLRFTAHLLDVRTAGRWGAPFLVIGDSFAERKDHDPWYQWPFASFSNVGCSRWLTSYLKNCGVSEVDLMWVNADQDLSFVHDLSSTKVFCLGRAAAEAAYREKLSASCFAHPQFHKRFSAGKPYPLIEKILESRDARV